MLAFSKLVLQIVINIFFRGGFFLFSDSVCCQSIYIFAKFIKLLIARFTAANWFIKKIDGVGLQSVVTF